MNISEIKEKLWKQSNNEPVQLTQRNVKELRDLILQAQNYKCAICGNLIDLEDTNDASLDHQHKNKQSDTFEDGNGLIRGVLCRACNSIEGKFWNASKRFMKFKNEKERIEWLKKLVEYYESPKYPFIHPSEKIKEKSLSKRNFNLMITQFKKKYQKKKLPQYPKSSKPTKRIIELFEEFGLSLYN